MICRPCRDDFHGYEMSWQPACPATSNGQPDYDKRTQCDCQHKSRKGEK